MPLPFIRLPIGLKPACEDCKCPRGCVCCGQLDVGCECINRRDEKDVDCQRDGCCKGRDCCVDD